MKAFKNANVYVAKKGIVKTDLIFNDKIISIGNSNDGEIIQLPDDAIILPGFIDQHIHGASGSDAMDGTLEDISTISKSLTTEGTVAFLATTMTQSPQNIKNALNAIKEFKANKNIDGAEVLGVHLEGPFISEKHIGAQPLEYVDKPNIATFQTYEKASGDNIKLVTLAPEENGSSELITYLKGKNIVTSVGHSDAGVNAIDNAINCGLQNVTHLFNAQRGIHHREIGTAGAALFRDELYCEIIADTIHLSVPALKFAVKNKPHDKIILITDAMRAKNLPDGISELGGQKVIVKNGEARLENGALAGSVLKMNNAIKNMVTKAGVDLTDAVDYATINPATNLGIANEYGSIEVGKNASFAIIDKEFNIIMTIRQGQIVYDNRKKTATISDDNIEVEISCHGAEIQKILYKGQNYLYDGTSPIWSDRSPVLFPYAGRLWNDELIFEGNKYHSVFHGFAYTTDFELYEQCKNSATFLLKYNKETLASYPFKFELYITYSVNNNKLSINKKIVNIDDKDIYFSTGTHEGISCDINKNNLSVVFSENENLNNYMIYPRSAYLIHETENFGQNVKEFKLKNQHFIDGNTLVFGDIKSNSLTLCKDGKSYIKYNFEYQNFLIWSDEKAPFICLEFWHNLPDFHQEPTEFSNKLGIMKVKKGETKTISHSLEMF